MAKLVIKGHTSRGKEVIKILKMLGGAVRVPNQFAGHLKLYGYYINSCGFIEFKHISGFDCDNDIIIYSLEEFLEEFPYKVGDKAKLDGWPCIITEMSWGYDDVVYSVKGVDFSKRVCSKDLQPYKEETMKEKLEQIKIDIPDGYEFFGIDYDNKIVLTKEQPQYQKTIEECAKVLSTLPHTRNGVNGYSSHALWKLQQLLICRDAYWKIAGEQMGLGKPWEPDWIKAIYTCTIISRSNKIIKDSGFDAENRILAFPTEEMRDVFYENFKDLIEECKEFL